MIEHTETDAAKVQASPPVHESKAVEGRRSVVPARLLLGVIVLICAEVFSGASVKIGLWSRWTWIVTFWLYFAHFFFFTSLAAYTARTSLTSLYLWGVLFGLYEGWITKVIWAGYSGVGEFILGSIGPFGFSEISMVFFFHPLISFILPLAVACLLYPSLRQLFPDLAWLTGKSRLARCIQIGLVVSFVPIMAMNSGGPVNLAANLAFAIILLFLLSCWASSITPIADERSIVVFGRRGFIGLCLYLALLYGVTYPFMRPEGIPSVAVQLLTLGIYAVTIVGLWLQPRREPLPDGEVHVDEREMRLVKTLFAILLLSALVASTLAGSPIIYLPILATFVVWSLLGFGLMAAALWHGVWTRFRTPALRPE